MLTHNLMAFYYTSGMCSEARVVVFSSRSWMIWCSHKFNPHGYYMLVTLCSLFWTSFAWELFWLGNESAMFSWIPVSYDTSYTSPSGPFVLKSKHIWKEGRSTMTSILWYFNENKEPCIATVNMTFIFLCMMIRSEIP